MLTEVLLNAHSFSASSVQLPVSSTVSVYVTRKNCYIVLNGSLSVEVNAGTDIPSPSVPPPAPLTFNPCSPSFEACALSISHSHLYTPRGTSTCKKRRPMRTILHIKPQRSLVTHIA